MSVLIEGHGRVLVPEHALDAAGGTDGAPVSGQRGGPASGEPAAAITAAPAEQTGTAWQTFREPAGQQSVPGSHDVAEAAEAERSASLEHTDEQDAIQAGAVGGDSTGGTQSGALPASGFKLISASSQPIVRALPDQAITGLREQLRATAVRQLGVSDEAARSFSERISQAGLVVAFLLAHLDLGLEVDPATARAAELFRSHDPLLGRMATRLDELARLDSRQEAELDGIRQEMRAVRSTMAVLEQVMSYQVADRAENLGRGTAGVGDLDLSHRSALRLRDMAREETQKQQRRERDRDGRPIR